MYWTCNNTSLEYMGGFEGKNQKFRGKMWLNNWVHTHWVQGMKIPHKEGTSMDFLGGVVALWFPFIEISNELNLFEWDHIGLKSN